MGVSRSDSAAVAGWGGRTQAPMPQHTQWRMATRVVRGSACGVGAMGLEANRALKILFEDLQILALLGLGRMLFGFPFKILKISAHLGRRENRAAHRLCGDGCSAP
jgi:hypothetical protein